MEEPINELAETAKEIRAAVNEVDDTYIRALVAKCGEVEDVGRCVKPSFSGLGGRDFAVTSWMGMGVYEYDWGKGLGMAEAVRLPKAAFDGLAIILPRRRDGGVEVFVGAKVEDMERLRADERWMGVARVVGEGGEE